MSEETMKILELLKEGKIDAEEAHELLEDLNSDDIIEQGGGKQIIKSGNKSPRGFGGWIHRILFKFIPMLLGFGVVFAFIYAFVYYLPTHLSHDTLKLLYSIIGGIAGIIVLCITLIALRGIALGKTALTTRISVGKGDKQVEIGGTSGKTANKEEVTNK